MKAVIMAGGEGTRLRPLSLGMPKPMVPLFGVPVMEHIIRLLHRHGITQICVTLCYLPQAVMDYFGDGSRLGVSLQYVREDKPLGTAGSVKNCMELLGKDDFLVISGDGVCDLDLSRAMAFHRARSAAATLVLYQHPAPLEYGLVVTDAEGRVQQFVEKPSWGQVVTNQVNTGIYVLSPSALDGVEKGTVCDFGKDLFPRLLAEEAGLYGCTVPGYWCDMGDCRAYLRCTADILNGKAALDLGQPQPSPGIWCDGPLPEGATLTPPCWIAPGARLEPGCLVGPGTVIGKDCAVGADSVVQRSVLLDGASVEERATVCGAILCANSTARRETVVNEGCVLGENALAEEGAVLLEGVRLWPAQTAPAHGRLAQSITTGGQRSTLTFGDGGVIRGTLGEDIGPEALMSLGSALGGEGKVGLGGWGGPGAKMLVQAACSGVAAAGGTALLHDMQCPAQAAWLAETMELPVSLFVEQEGERIYLHLFGRGGLPLGRARERKLEHALLQGEFLRAGADRVGGTQTVRLTPADYAVQAARRARLSHLPMRPLTVAVAGESPADRAIRAALAELGCTLEERWRRGIPAFAASHGGFYLNAQDETGALLDPGQLLAAVTLIEMEQGRGQVAVPAGGSAAVDLVAAGYNGTVLRLDRDGAQARELYQSLPWLRDAAFASARICARLGTTGERLEALMGKTPRFSSWKREVPLSSNRSRVMQALAQEHRRSHAGEGLRFRDGGGWVYLVPLARRCALQVVAEGPDLEVAAELCDFYAQRCVQLDRQAALEEGDR